MIRNEAKKLQGECASLSRGWKKALQKNTRKKSRQMASTYIKTQNGSLEKTPKGNTMKKFIMILIVLIMASSAWAIELTTTGTYMWETNDSHMVNIQGETYAISKEDNPQWMYIKEGCITFLKFTLNDEDMVSKIEIVGAKWVPGKHSQK